MRYLATHVVLLALAPLQPAFSQQAQRQKTARRYLPSDLDDARETDDTIEWDDDHRGRHPAVGLRWRRWPYGVIDDDGWAARRQDPGAELALVIS